MTPARIVAATPDDIQAILALDQTCAEAPHWTEAQYRAIVSPSQDAPERCLLVAKSPNEITGFAAGKLVADEAELETVAVSPMHRRSGLGRALCTAVITWAWDRGARRMELEVRASSVGPLALYRDLGFVIVGRRTKYYAAPRENAVLMRLER